MQSRFACELNATRCFAVRGIVVNSRDVTASRLDAERIAEYRGMATDSSMVSISHGYTTSAVDAKWPWLFPDYPLATMMPIPATWSEMSWRHEVAPSFGPCVGPMGEAAQIWIDYADPAKRDVPESSRFTVSRRDAIGELTVIYAGDDYDAVLTHASIEALACSLSNRVAYEMTAEEWQETRLRNRTTPDNVCASHDFMDTNILMLEAWEAERGNALLPGGERERFEESLAKLTEPSLPLEVLAAVRGEVAALPLKGVIDVAAEGARLQKELAKADSDIARVDQKLNNPKFVANADEEVVAEEREKREEAVGRRAKILEAVERLKAAS